ncbi:MAG: hypothetical protein WC867_08395 [Candidatus Pacearchaeota archaeon]|jgi:hypothetical protein
MTTNEYDERTKQISRRYFIAQIANLTVGSVALTLTGAYNASIVNRIYEQDKTLENKLERLEELHGLEGEAKVEFIKNQTEYLDFSEEEIERRKQARDKARTDWKGINKEIDQIYQDPSVDEYQSTKVYGTIRTFIIGLLIGLNSIRLFRNKSREMDDRYQNFSLGYRQAKEDIHIEQEKARLMVIESQKLYGVSKVQGEK